MQRVALLNAYLQQMYCREFHVRIGLHYGPAVVGHIGGHGFRKLATIGDTVNVAARIESANKGLGTYFLVSEAVVEATGGTLEVRQGFLMPLKGKKGLHRLFEVAVESLALPGQTSRIPPRSRQRLDFLEDCPGFRDKQPQVFPVREDGASK
jgi:adenylate cyclase